MKKKYTYYRGVFNSQFSIASKVKSDSKHESKLRIDFFNLEIGGKKELVNAVKISENEFTSLLGCQRDPLTCTCVLHNSGKSFPLTRNEVSFLEVSEGGTDKERNKEYDQLTLVFYKDASNFLNTEQDFFNVSDRHGKLSSMALLRVIEEVQEKPKLSPVSNKVAILPVVEEIVNPTQPIINNKNNGCFSGTSGGFGNGQQGCFGNSIAGRISGGLSSGQQGCFGGTPHFLPGFGGSFAGCFGGNGCFAFPALGSIGCFSLGGIFQLLKLLIGLGLLLYLFSQIRTCESNSNFKDNVVYVYDTIQVVKYDTLKVIEKSEIKITTTDKISLPNVQFKTNSDELIDGSLPDIQSLAEFLSRNDSVTAVIEGHTDDIGNSENNMALSKARSESVKKLLVRLGIDESRISTEGYGNTRPKAVLKGSFLSKPDTTLEGRLINRRVEVKLNNLGTTTNTESSKQ